MRRYIAILLCMAVAVGAVACQPTPERAVVVGKDTDRLIENASKDTSAPFPSDASGCDLYERIGAPETYSAELVSSGGKLHVFADARVVLPSCELPIVRMKPVEFTQAQAKQFAAVLIDSDAKFVRYDADNPTKGEYERRIELLRYGLQNWEEKGQYIFDLRYNTAQEAEAALAELVSKAASAPEAYESYTPDFSWEYHTALINGYEVNNENTYITLFATTDNTVYSLFEISNTREFNGKSSFTYLRDCDAPRDVFFTEPYSGDETLTISEDSAVRLAAQALADMGVSGYACSASIPSKYRTANAERMPVYHIVFTRQVNGAVETCTNVDTIYNEYGDSRDYEKINFLIDDDGIVRVEYNNPCEVVGTVIDETDLLPFDKIRAIFEKMVTIVGNNVDFNSVFDASGGVEYHITEVRLGLVSISEHNSDNILLVPAWDFLGYERGANIG